MNLQILNPLEISDWDNLVLATGKASFFHSAAWARVISESYGYKPLYFTALGNGSLASMAPFMEIDSWLTGKRGVSLPFTDECPQIAADSEMSQEMVKPIIDYGEKAGWKYVEWRNGQHFPDALISSDFYFTHEINLTQTEKELLSAMRDSTRRNIRKASREGVLVEISRSHESIKSFFRLNCLTRQRHGVPPQPFSFFSRVYDHIISKGQGTIVSALHSGKMIASAIFFNFGTNVIYKYGASDSAHQNLRPNNLILWKAVRYYREQGFETLNFGRTEPESKGLLQFKRGWGAEERLLKYYRYDFTKGGFCERRAGMGAYRARLFSQMPVLLLRTAGSLVYKHVG